MTEPSDGPAEKECAAVARAYGLGEPLRPPAYAARGELGRIWRLDTTGGTWAVKESLVPREEHEVRADHAFQLAAAKTGIQLPAPRLTSDGMVLFGRFRVYEWVDLADGEVVTPEELGAATARLHRIGHPADGPVIAWFAEPVGRARWEALVRTGLDASEAGPGWVGALERLVPELVALDALVVPPDPRFLATCHRDVNVENVLRARDGGVVVLDWENCGAARPDWELAKVLAELPPQDAVRAWRAYRDEGGPGVVAEPSDFSMAIAEQGHLLEFYAHRALSPQESAENRSRARFRLRTMLGRPLTRARIDALLASG